MHEGTTNASGEHTDEERLRARGATIERLLAEVEASVGPLAWPRVEELVRCLVDLYGAGLDRVVSHARASGARPGELEVLLSDDDLVTSLLALHGTHPVAASLRVARALARALALSRGGASALRLDGITDGVATVRVEGATAATVAGVEHVVHRAIERAAPEITGVRFVGLPAAEPRPAPGLISADRLRRRTTP